MPSSRTLLVALILVALPLAGCFGSEAIPNERTFQASGGTASAGWAYDGEGLEPASATLNGNALNAENTGAVTSKFQYAGSEWEVTFDQFAASADFQDGGVAFDLVEHGGTGVADASIPTILAKVAIWGTAAVLRDGEPELAPSGAGEWVAHLMISDTTVRAANGKISKADGSSPYDPAAPADATRVEGDMQAFLVLKSADGVDAKREPVPVTGSAQFLGPESTQSIDVPATNGSHVLLNVVADAGSAPLAAGQVTFRLVDEAGEVVATASGNVAPNQPVTGVLELLKAPGPMKVEIVGQGAFTATVEGALIYHDEPFIVLTWDDVTLS